MSVSHDCKPASEVIAKLGGTASVARILNKDQSTIRRWRMPRPEGTGGAIPNADKVRLLEHAFAEGIALTWDDFKPPELTAPA